jgi:hypothetical protein
MSRVVDPFRSTYLNKRLGHILGQVADNNFALAGRSCTESGGFECRGWFGGLVLRDAAGWCSDGGFGLGFGAAGRNTASRAIDAASGGLCVLHDLVERLVEFSGHLEDGCAR